MANDLSSILLKYLPFEPTPGQNLLISKLEGFLFSKDFNPVFILKGYAGTGKTSIIGGLVKSLPELKLKSILLAPTGKAAKVLANYSRQQAITIHKKIYKRQGNDIGFGKFNLQKNIHVNTIFVVDEASMISSSGSLISEFSSGHGLLDDLINFVYQGINCRLIVIGDTAQLPPVGLDLSPALDITYLQQNYSLSINFIELKEVVRQAESSGILANATRVRNMIPSKGEIPKFSIGNYSDIEILNGSELEDKLNQSYSKYGAEGTMVICRSNKRANIYNQQIRSRIRWQEEEIAAGDFMMVVKNNYFWLKEESKAGFIANGDTVELIKIRKIKKLYGFRFAEVRLRMIDYPDDPELETIILLDTIMSESPSMTSLENKKLYEAVMADYLEIQSKWGRIKKVKENPYFNALQVKFAYAITCHKAQGGQWPCVFAEQGYVTKEMINTEFLRWLYTAITRATEKLYLVNFNKDFFEA